MTIDDSVIDEALSKVGSKAMFTEEIEELFEGRIDLAVYSLRLFPLSLLRGSILA